MKRSYNDEYQDNGERQYVYNFDFDVMHGFMLKYCRDYIVEGNCLELGSFEGEFTKRLISIFDDITCIEAASNALAIAKSKFGSKVKYISGTFEETILEQKYDNIFLTHVLEHVEDRVGLLSKIKDEWLAPGGRLFVICPNANAASRQIAVNMGLISHNAAVTPGEKLHGHYITYSSDTLAADINSANLKIFNRGGIFFKALANFQWDKVISEQIVTNQYLEACYEFGKLHPDLCSSIVMVCEHSDNSAAD